MGCGDRWMDGWWTVRKFLLALLLSCGLCGVSVAGLSQMMQMVIAKKNAGGGGWSQTLNSDGTSERTVGNASSDTYQGFQFTADNTGTIDSIDLYCREWGTPGAYTFDLEIWSNSGDSPDTLLTNGSVQFDLADAPSTSSDFNIAFSTGPNITSGTSYWIVLHADQIDAFNYLRVSFQPTGTDGWDNDRSSDGSTWNALDFDANLRAVINGS